VNLVAATVDHRVELRVRDEGPGFPSEFLPHAFQRFSRAETGRSSPGTGLGLAIVSTIATAHDGSVAVTNATDGGAEIVISLPAGARSALESSR
jgi:signal transduction histidine kinase